MHISLYMRRNALSDDDFAIIIGRSRATVSRIRRGKVRPDWDTIQRIRTATKGAVTANDFAELVEVAE